MKSKTRGFSLFHLSPSLCLLLWTLVSSLPLVNVSFFQVLVVEVFPDPYFLYNFAIYLPNIVILFFHSVFTIFVFLST